MSEAADVGSAGHEHMMLRARLGIDDAVAVLDETIAKFNISEDEATWLRARLMKFTWTPPAGALAEIRLAWMPDGSVQRVPADARFFPGAVFTGQFDDLWSEPEPLRIYEDGRVECPEGSALFVLDLKFGQDRYVQSIENNAQVSSYAVLAAKWTGARVVVPAVLFPGPGDGDWDVPAEPWRAQELAQAEARIHETLSRVAAAERALANGEPLDLVEGRHCEYCPALTECPAKIRMLKAMLRDGPPAPGPLTPEEAALTAVNYKVLERVRHMQRAALEAYVHQYGPVPMGDGVQWGPQTTVRKRVLPMLAKPILDAELGTFAVDAMQIKVTETGIKDAVRNKLNAAGHSRGVAPIVRRIYGKLTAAGALTKEERTEWCEHRGESPASAELGEVEDLEPEAPPPANDPVQPEVSPELFEAFGQGAVESAARFRGRRRARR
jgi:hypothetical protein